MTSATNVTTIDILRHGKTEGGEIFRGRTDVALSGEGLLQMQQALKDVQGWQHIVTSPMLRCAGFSQQLARQKAIGCSVSDALREISFGDWDGQLLQDIRQQQPDQFASFWRDPVNHSPPNAEPMADFISRVRCGFWQAVNDNQGRHLLLVVHGGVVRAILSDILQTSMVSLMRFDVPYACLTRISIYHEGDQHWPQLVFHNRTSTDVSK